MKILPILVAAAVVSAATVAIGIRLWPIDPVTFHAEPLSANKLSGQRDWLVRPGPGDGAAPVFADDPVDLMQKLAAVALAEPRTRQLAGSIGETWMTFVVRSQIIGFPDIVSVRTLPEGTGTTLAIWSRSRFGGYDWGVNRARVERWIRALGVPIGSN